MSGDREESRSLTRNRDWREVGARPHAADFGGAQRLAARVDAGSGAAVLAERAHVGGTAWPAAPRVRPRSSVMAASRSRMRDSGAGCRHHNLRNGMSSDAASLDGRLQDASRGPRRRHTTRRGHARSPPALGPVAGIRESCCPEQEQGRRCESRMRLMPRIQSKDLPQAIRSIRWGSA